MGKSVSHRAVGTGAGGEGGGEVVSVGGGTVAGEEGVDWGGAREGVGEFL